jgi:hypothetical protein
MMFGSHIAAAYSLCTRNLAVKPSRSQPTLHGWQIEGRTLLSNAL